MGVLVHHMSQIHIRAGALRTYDQTWLLVSACCQTCSVLYGLKRGHKSGGIGIPPGDH